MQHSRRWSTFTPGVFLTVINLIYQFSSIYIYYYSNYLQKMNTSSLDNILTMKNDLKYKKLNITGDESFNLILTKSRIYMLRIATIKTNDF